MDLRYTAEDKVFRARVRRWLAEHAPCEPLRTIAEKRAWHRKLYEAGYLGMGWPKAYGGREARPVEQAIVVEEMARAKAPASVNWAGLGLVGPTLIHHGTDAQRERYLRSILLGDEIWCQLYSEPNAGSDLASLQCRAEIDRDEFVVNGQKIWTSTAPEADMGILLVRTDRDAPKHQGISYLIVDMRQPGIEVRPLRQITGIEDEFAEVFFSNVRVPADSLIGELNSGWRIAQTTLSYERGGDTMGIVARLQQSFERLLEIAGTTRRDGRLLIDDLLVRRKLGQIMAEIEVLRYASLRILSSVEKGNHPGPESSLSKLHYSELDKRLYTLMHEILGPYGQVTNTARLPTAARPDMPTPPTEARTSTTSGPTCSCSPSPRRSTPAHRKSRRTSSASASSACRKNCAPIGPPASPLVVACTGLRSGRCMHFQSQPGSKPSECALICFIPQSKETLFGMRAC